jgi:MoaA/NifB/PqqE/SkfB family radical SAM enzyme
MTINETFPPNVNAAKMDSPGNRRLRFLWLEITGKCQLTCSHCYASSSPTGTHGAMTPADWRQVITQAAVLGVRTVQFIGGEPTLHPHLTELIDQALTSGLRVEVFSNLVRVTPQLWETFARPGVSLATSYYADTPEQHEAITQRRGSYLRTKTNIGEAVRRSIPLRVGIIDLGGQQRTQQARVELTALGVTSIAVDHLRQVGRGIRDLVPSVGQLCGQCADGVAAIAPDGAVWPCVFARWMPLGNVRTSALADIMGGPALGTARKQIAAAVPSGICNPNCCPSNMCDPQCSPSCSPSCRPAGNCTPSGNCAPAY